MVSCLTQRFSPTQEVDCWCEEQLIKTNISMLTCDIRKKKKKKKKQYYSVN